LRHKVHGPVFASFDGVTGGMILDLSEQGLSMQRFVPLEAGRRFQVRLDLPDSEPHLETTGYIAWADALGRAGVRFSELPAEARQRLDAWLTLNDAAPSNKAPTLTVEGVHGRGLDGNSAANGAGAPRSISLEADAGPAQPHGRTDVSSSIQYEFNSLGSDLYAALGMISERACTLIRGTGAAIALSDGGSMLSDPAVSPAMVCRASVGTGGPPLGTVVDINSGFSGECVRTGKNLRCDDAKTDPRIEAGTFQRLGIRSIVAAPIRYEREVVGLLEVFSPLSFAFDEGDLGVLDRLAQTALLVISQTQLFKRS
jgi:GAF domain/PilZ domain